jgi:hypothetical protein
MADIKKQRLEKLKKEIDQTFIKNVSLNDIVTFCNKLYEKGYCALDILEIIENDTLQIVKTSNERKYELLLAFNKIRKEFRNEKLIMLFIFNFLFLSLDVSLENISFM